MGNGAAKIGYAAMLEQFGPQEVVDYSVAAERAGMSGVMAADHFQPWVPEQGNAPFVWNVMTLIAERTKGDIGPGVTCPGWR
ncbi:MAG: LLM class flavin-dependent oxidoreductase, partial [Candidatus Limnocylindrus sp.]